MIATTIDAPLLTAFFGGLALLIATLGKLYLDLKQVHKAVNSNMTEALSEIKELNERVAVLVAKQRRSR
jgi:hypothetical protein